MSPSSTFVIVGAGLAGAKAAETLRSEGFDGRIVLVGAEDERPYERPPLSKSVLLGEDEESSAFVHEAEWYERNEVELRLGTRATSLKPAEHAVWLEDGERLAYDKLALATGASPRRLEVEGAALDGVTYLRTMVDSRRLRDTLAGGGSVVVVGAGWIGLEVAAAARHHGCAVTIVEPAATPLGAVLGPEMGQFFADLHRDHGVDLRLGRGVSEITGGSAGARTVRLDDETTLPADLVVVGIGVSPNTALAEDAGLVVDDGIGTDESLRTSDPDVLAVGDVASWRHPRLGRRIRVEHWANAHDGGPAAARTMLGQSVSYDALPFFFSDQYDLGLEYAGVSDPDGYERVVVRGDRAGREFCAFWLSQQRVVAGMNVNVWDVQDQIQQLIRSARPVDVGRLSDPGVPLNEV